LGNVELCQGGGCKLFIFAMIKMHPGVNVGKITPPVSCNQYFFPDAGIPLQESDLGTHSTGCNGRDHTGSPAADDNNMMRTFHGHVRVSFNAILL
jgi:hypothetical protein